MNAEEFKQKLPRVTLVSDVGLLAQSYGYGLKFELVITVNLFPTEYLEGAPTQQEMDTKTSMKVRHTEPQ